MLVFQTREEVSTTLSRSKCVASQRGDGGCLKNTRSQFDSGAIHNMEEVRMDEDSVLKTPGREL